MTAAVLSGPELAARVRPSVIAGIAAMPPGASRPACAVVAPTVDEPGGWYVRSIAAAAEKVGISCEIVDLGQDATPELIGAALADLSAAATVSGIIAATPLPGGGKLSDFGHLIDPAKDVDGANPLSLGRLAVGLPAFAPATAEAGIRLLERYDVALAGRHAVVVGRSAVAGKPGRQLLLDRHATVTICHSRPRDLEAITRTANVLIAAVGRAGLITADHVRPGAVVIDVGTNSSDDGGLVGGVGPLTTALLLAHVLAAADGGGRGLVRSE